jgi:anti-sigma factor RsiW
MENMCPDREILSVYFDDELGSPWKEKLESHLADCPQCRGRLELYGSSRQLMTASVDDSAMEAAGSRVREKLDHLFLSRRKPGAARHFWGGSFTLPYPVAAAAGFVLIAAFALLLALRPQSTPEPQLASIDIEASQVSDMATLLEYLKSDTSTDMVIIKLPETTFTSAGDPRVIRAADYSRNEKRK